jgi:hypothetical protein
MLGSFKGKSAEQDRSTAANADGLIGKTVQPSHKVVEQVASGPEPTATRKSGRDSCIGSDMSIVGNVDCKGPAQRHCAERDSLRPRQGHYPCRSRQAAERWCSRGRHFSSVVINR